MVHPRRQRLYPLEPAGLADELVADEDAECDEHVDLREIAGDLGRLLGDMHPEFGEPLEERLTVNLREGLEYQHVRHRCTPPRIALQFLAILPDTCGEVACAGYDSWRRLRGEPEQRDGPRVLQPVSSVWISVAQLALFRGRQDRAHPLPRQIGGAV